MRAAAHAFFFSDAIYEAVSTVNVTLAYIGYCSIETHRGQPLLCTQQATGSTHIRNVPLQILLPHCMIWPASDKKQTYLPHVCCINSSVLCYHKSSEKDI